MEFSQARIGRVFILRLEQGEVVHEVLENFAVENNIKCAAMIMLGAANEGSKMTVGPKNGYITPIIPFIHQLSGVHELAGVGTLFPDEEGHPSLHSHVAAGREEDAIVGCISAGVVVWTILEVILIELEDCDAKRVHNSPTGFNLLSP
ncbi:MAG: DNA-binding protein [Euryarchaeota archaeon]|nr:DNA-binding protein [Euryarchaeota archaeon]